MSDAHRTGDTIGPWCLDRHLGEGSFGSTWLAKDAAGRPAALKLLRQPPGDELRVLARLAHPAIPAVLGAANHPVPHVAMEFAPGRTLEGMLKHGRAPEAAALQVVAVLADALAEVHRAGLPHGDLKPENVLVDSIGQLRIWLVDFGAAADQSVGTLHYAAPERTRGESATPASDLYSLGLILFEMLFGHLPGFDESTSAALMKRRTERPEIPASCSPRVRELLGRMLEPDPALRPSAAQVADALEAHGLRLTRPTGAILRRRARAVHVPVPGFASKLEAWLSKGGAFSVVGPQGTGRSHALNRAVTELQANGASWLKMPASDIPWHAVAEALACPTLGGTPADLPTEPDPGLRAQLAAEALARRAEGPLFLIVDDLDHALACTRETIEALTKLDDVHVFATSTERWACATDHCTLTPMSRADLGQLLASTLGDPGPIEDLVDRLERTTGLLPGMAIDALATACDSGALVRSARRWHLDGSAFAEVVERLAAEESTSLTTSGPDVTAVAALVAIYGRPVALADVARQANLPGRRLADALAELEAHQVVRVEGVKVRIASARMARSAEASCGHAAKLHAAVLTTAPDRTPLQILNHLVRARSTPLSERFGPGALVACVDQAPEAAARLASDLWAATPTPRIAGPVLDALLAGGKPALARTIGATLLEAGSAPRGVLLAMARQAIHVADAPAEALPLLAEARTRPQTGAGLDLALLAAQAHFKLGQHAEAVEVARSACATDPGSRGKDRDAWVTLHCTWAQATHALGETPTAVSILEGVPHNVADGRASHAVMLSELGRLYWLAGRVGEAAAALTEASEHPELPALTRARMANNAGVAFYSTGERPKALERWEQALHLFTQLDIRLEQVRVSNNLCVAYTEAGRWQRARSAGESAYTSATELKEHGLAAMSAGNLGDLFAARAAWDDATLWYGVASTLADTHNVESEKVELARRRASVAVARRDADALEHTEHAIEVATAAGDDVEATRGRILRALCLARTAPHTPGLQATLDAGIQVFRDKQLTGHLAEARAWSAEVLLELGHGKEAETLIESVAAHAESTGHVPLQQRAAQLRAWARTLVVRTPERDKFERMLNLATRVAREQDPTRLLDAIAAAGLELLDAERSFVVLVEGKSFKVVRAIGHNGPLTDPQARPSRTILEKGLHRSTPYTALDVSERQELNKSKSIMLNALRSAMCVPMRDRDQLLGLLYVDSTRTTEQQLSDAGHLMQALASHAAVAIGHARHLAALERRAERAAELVHDLRSPIAAAVSILQELRDDVLADDSSPQLHDEAIELLAKSMELAEQVLQGRDHAEETVLDISHRLREVGQQLDRYAQRQGRSVMVEVDGPARLLCTPDHFDRIIRNLVGNALRFSPPRGTVWIRLTPGEDGARVTITDEGDGIPEALLGKLFQRGAKGTTEKSQHGLGLAIVQRLVQQIGGTVRADNSDNAGACFTLTFPTLREPLRQSG